MVTKKPINALCTVILFLKARSEPTTNLHFIVWPIDTYNGKWNLIRVEEFKAMRYCRRKMILIDQGNDRTSSRLLLANMDGKNLTQLATRPRMISVTVDCIADIIYWSEADNYEAKIIMMKMDGSSKRVNCLRFIYERKVDSVLFIVKMTKTDNVIRSVKPEQAYAK